MWNSKERPIRISLILICDFEEYTWFHWHSQLGLTGPQRVSISVTITQMPMRNVLDMGCFLFGVCWFGFCGVFFCCCCWVWFGFFSWWNLSPPDYCSCHLSQWFLKGSGKYGAATDGYTHAFLCWVGFLLLSNLSPEFLLGKKKIKNLLMRFLYCSHQ